MNDKVKKQTTQNGDKDQWDEALVAYITGLGVDVYLYSGEINNLGYTWFINQLIETQRKRLELSKKSNTKSLLILSTLGGIPMIGFNIANQLLNAYSDGFDIFIPNLCKSTGTMIALGANSLLMNKFSELGPLDIQLSDRENLGSRRSGLEYKYVFESLGPEFAKLFVTQTLRIRKESNNGFTTKQAAEYAKEFVKESMKSVFAQLNPLDISRDYRDLMIVENYGKTLAKISGNISEESIEKLVNEYPSHDYVIDDKEAKELFYKVFLPDWQLWKLISLKKYAMWSSFTYSDVPFVNSVTLDMLSDVASTK